MSDDSLRKLYEIAVLEADLAKKDACFKAGEDAINLRVAALGGEISRNDLLTLREARKRNQRCECLNTIGSKV
jgi:uncharacterized small protein (DUF1192 family)